MHPLKSVTVCDINLSLSKVEGMIVKETKWDHHRFQAHDGRESMEMSVPNC